MVLFYRKKFSHIERQKIGDFLFFIFLHEHFTFLTFCYGQVIEEDERNKTPESIWNIYES